MQPQHGLFVEQRLRHLLRSGTINTQVVAPVPWFPRKSPLFQQFSKFSDVDRQEERFGISILHPRFLTIPKIGMSIAPWLMAQSCNSEMQRVCNTNPPVDLIDAHYFYPDGIAATMLGKKLGKPVIITARGTDINLIPKFAIPRKQILWAANHSAAIITVSIALKNRLLELGVAEKKITVLRNGVDLELFRPVDQEKARRALGGWQGTWLLSVGHLVERKGHHLIIDALKDLPGVQLAIAGDGPLKHQLAAQVEALGLTDRVRFLGPVDHSDLRSYYSAADALVLASSREGMANVLLESLACGLPIVATPIWGTPEVISRPEAGVLTKSRSAASIVTAVRKLLNNYPDRGSTRKYGELFSWDATTNGQMRLFERISDKS